MLMTSKAALFTLIILFELVSHCYFKSWWSAGFGETDCPSVMQSLTGFKSFVRMNDSKKWITGGLCLPVSCLLSSCSFRDCVPGVLVDPLLWALHHCAVLLEGWHLRLQEGLDLRWRHLALLSPLDLAALPRLEQLRPRGTWDHVLRPVAPPFNNQHLICVVSLRLLSAAAPSAHDLLLWPNPGCDQEGEFEQICQWEHFVFHTFVTNHTSSNDTYSFIFIKKKEDFYIFW